jgi:outer membrane protein assembly factor BamB
VKKKLAAAGAVAAGVIVALLALRAGGARVVREGGSSSPPAAGTSSPAAPTGGSKAKTSSTPTVATLPASASAGSVVIQGGYGSEPGQFGRRRDPESNPEAPMAVAAGPNGQLAVVDQVNRRILRYKDGKLVGTIPTGGDTVQDIAFGHDGKLLVLDRLVDGNVQVYGADGKLANEVSIAGKGVTEGGSVTGVFSDENGIYVENDHDSVVRIADASGAADPNRPALVGRPSRDGRSLLAAEIADAAAGIVTVSAVDRSTGQPAWKQSIPLGSSILHIITLDSDANGLVYLAVDVGREVVGAGVSDEKILLLRLGSGGAPRGLLAVPPMPTADESFRPITVGDDGSVYVMAAGDGGLAVTRYVFP